MNAVSITRAARMPDAASLLGQTWQFGWSPTWVPGTSALPACAPEQPARTPSVRATISRRRRTRQGQQKWASSSECDPLALQYMEAQATVCGPTTKCNRSAAWRNTVRNRSATTIGPRPPASAATTDRVYSSHSGAVVAGKARSGRPPNVSMMRTWVVDGQQPSINGSRPGGAASHIGDSTRRRASRTQGEPAKASRNVGAMHPRKPGMAEYDVPVNGTNHAAR